MTQPTPGEEERRARASDLVVGLVKAFRPWSIGLLVVAGLVVIFAFGANRPQNPVFVDAGGPGADGGITFEERRILVGDRCLRVEVADTQEKRAQGLKNRDGLGELHGMLFEFDSMGQRGFTMSGVRFPLTIGFYDDAGVRVDALDMEPCPEGSAQCPTYQSRNPFRNALEVARNQLPEGPLVPACPG